MITEEQVREALRECYDPEIPINIVDLGLVYEIKIKDNNIDIKMTLTAPGCPMHRMIANEVKERLKKIEGVKNVNVEIVWEPQWTPDRIAKSAREKLGV